MSLEVCEIIARSILFCLVVKPTHICIDTYLHCSLSTFQQVGSDGRAMDAARPAPSTIAEDNSPSTVAAVSQDASTAKTPQWKEALGASPLLRCILQLDK